MHPVGCIVDDEQFHVLPHYRSSDNFSDKDSDIGGFIKSWFCHYRKDDPSTPRYFKSEDKFKTHYKTHSLKEQILSFEKKSLPLSCTLCGETLESKAALENHAKLCNTMHKQSKKYNAVPSTSSSSSVSNASFESSHNPDHSDQESQEGLGEEQEKHIDNEEDDEGEVNDSGEDEIATTREMSNSLAKLSSDAEKLYKR